MSTVTQLITAEQLYRMPADGFRYEIVRGELKKMTPSGFTHGKVVVKLTAPLAFHVEANSTMVWVLSPRLRTIHVHRPNSTTRTLNENDSLEGHEVIPGFRIKVAEIFS